MRISTQDKNGNWIPATPLQLMCEIENCDVTDNKIGDILKEYFRNPEESDGSDWDSEPIILCEKHSANHLKCPKNLEDVFEWLLKITSDKNDLNKWLKLPEDDAIISVHHTIGMAIRNELGLWHNGTIVPFFHNLGIFHADDMSTIILTSFHRSKNNIDIKLEEQVKHYIDYWEKENPDVNKGIL
jgi:hypothetical protein